MKQGHGFHLTRLPANIVRKAASLIAVLLLSAGSLLAQAESSVWVISSGDEKVYVGGTVHLLRASDFPLPPQYEQAYQDADKLYFETDINGMNDPSLQMRMMTALTYQDGRTLQSVLNEEAYTALSTHMAGAGLPIAMVQNFKPGLISSTLTVMEMQKMGFTPQGVDAFYNMRAMNDGKPVGQLESLDEQIGFIAAMGEGNESEFILLTLQDLEKTDMIEEMIAAWRVGDNEGLSRLFIEDMKDQSEDLYEAILVKRNHNWMPIIEGMFREEGTELVLVGAAHLVGEDGLLELLAGKGYTVSRL